MAYLSSNSIKIFPAVRRTGSADPFSRLMSESTITSIINRLIDYDGFVITHSAADNKSISSGVFEFNVFGYYIRIADVSELLSNFTSAVDVDLIYASILLDETETNPGESNNLTYVQLYGQDTQGSASSYEGVNFGIGQPTNTGSYTLHFLPILEKQNDIWVVPETSYLKFSKDTLALYDIDGGEI